MSRIKLGTEEVEALEPRSKEISHDLVSICVGIEQRKENITVRLQKDLSPA